MRKTLLMSLLACSTMASAGAAQVSFDSLLKEMTNRDSVARMPDPSFELLQRSSYDPRATSADIPKLWWSNTDHTHFIRTETNKGREEFVMFEDEGGGALVRWWMTWKSPQPKGNKLRIYIDHNPEPVIEASVEEIMGGNFLVGAPLSNIVPCNSRNLYLPIPYAKHCKITFEGPPCPPFYYIINYRSYEDGTLVKSFTRNQLQEHADLIAATQEQLKDAPLNTADHHTKDLRGELAAGSERSIALHGPAAIRGLKFKLAANDLEQALRSTVLKIEFDGAQTVYAPIGEFFGTGYAIHPYQSWYSTVTEDGTMTCQWVMPFAHSARITVENLGTQTVSLADAEVSTGTWKWDERSMHFGSTWFELTKIESRRKSVPSHYDVNFVTLKGKGNYVGDTLTLFNGYYFWWGEGDEKIYVDGDTFPTHFGTGSEDYYGYAWGNRSKEFSAPFHAQPSAKGNASPGLTVNLRQRSLDTIPFQTSLKVDMELLHKRHTRINYAPTTYWYAMPGVKFNKQPDPETVRLPVVKKVEDLVDVFPTEGLLEAEEMKVVNISGGETEIDTRGDTAVVSRFTSLRWNSASVGDGLTLSFEVDKSLMLPLFARMIRVDDPYIVEISVNGKQLAEDVNMRSKSGQFANVALGNVSLKAGENTITFTLTDAPSTPRPYTLNFDCLLAEENGKRVPLK